MKVIVTGATGFVGKALALDLLSNDFEVNVLVRKLSDIFPVEIEQTVVGDFTGLSLNKPSDSIRGALKGAVTVIHTAARVHVMNDEASDSLSEFRKVNCDATLELARFAAEAGIKRFVFLSSIKVNGELTPLRHPFTPEDQNIPVDPYGLSKYEAEQGLLALSAETGMEVVIIRPPLVYGPGVKANFASMMNWVGKRIPLPFGAIHNKRSLVALDNLVDFIALCVDREKSPKAANQVFLISDNEDVSTTQLLRKVAKSQNNQVWLIPVPVSFMAFAAKLIGKGDMANRLFGSLQVDSSKALELLGWRPVTTMDEQLKKTVQENLSGKNK